MTAYSYSQNRAYAAEASGRPPRAAAGGAPRKGARPTGQRRPANGARPTGQRRPANGARPSGRRPANRPAPRRTGKAKGWRRIPAKVRLAICAAVLALAVFGVVKLTSRVVVGEDRFVNNVYVNGICLSGYTREEGFALVEQARDERLSAVYTLTYAGRSWTFTPTDFNAQMDCGSELERAWNLGHVGDSATRRQIVDNLKQVPAEFNSKLTYDKAAMEAFIGGIAGEIDVEAVDAEVTLGTDKPIITQPSKNGLKLDQEKAQENLVALLETGAGDTVLPVEEVLPAVASEDMQMRVVAKFSTDVTFRNAASRANVRLALSYFNGFQVSPGDTCNFNDIVGPRTKERGFNKAPEYAGNETTTGYGGGVCQASTTLYNAVVMANLTVLERHSHSMTVSYVKPSQDAAVEYTSGGKNFIFRNDTNYTYYIYTNVDKELATVTIYGTRPEYHYELESVIVSEQKTTRKRYEYDWDGKHAFLTTDTKLKEEGHGECVSEGWLVAYDWNTKQEVSREMINHDTYRPGISIYWRGVHDAAGNVVVN